MTSIQQAGAVFNKHRTFPSIRSIVLVRFDPGNRDAWNALNVRIESTPDPYIAARRTNQFKGLIANPQNPLVARSLEVGPRVFSRDDFRAALTSASVNLADAVARMPNPDGLSRFIDLQPLKSTRRVNSYRLPDELEVTINWKALPFDSRLVRAILIFHYEGTVTADSFAVGQPELAPDVPNATGFLVPATGDNLRFVGQVDEIADAHDDSGDVLQMKARDLTSVLIDTKLPPDIEKKILPGSTLQEVVLNLLKTNDDFGILRGPFLRIQPGSQLPKLDPTRYPRLAVSPKERHRQDATGAQPYILRYSSKAGDETYWDAITDLCVSHGLVPTVEKDQLILMEPRTLFKDTPTLTTSPGTPRFPKPNGHREQIGDNFPVRRMVYGVNIKALRFFRKLGRVKAPAVRVTSFNPDAKPASKRLISVFHPPQADLVALAQSGEISKKSAQTGGTVAKPSESAIGGFAQATKVDATGQKQTIEVHNIVIEGVVDVEQLKKIAEQVYEAMGRQELGITLMTDEIASFSDNVQFDPILDPDLLDLQAGDPIQILVAPAERRGSNDIFSLAELNLLVKRSQTLAAAYGEAPAFSSAIEYLKQIGFKEADAIQLVKVLSTQNLPQEFRVNTVQVSFDGEGSDGFSIQIDARDYIRVRADPTDISATGVLPNG